MEEANVLCIMEYSYRYAGAPSQLSKSSTVTVTLVESCPAQPPLLQNHLQTPQDSALLLICALRRAPPLQLSRVLCDHTSAFNQDASS